VAAGGGPLGPGTTRTLQVTGRSGVPTTGVGAVVLNITAVAPTTGGYLTIHPTGTPKPNASNLNFAPGQTIPNLVVAQSRRRRPDQHLQRHRHHPRHRRRRRLAPGLIGHRARRTNQAGRQGVPPEPALRSRHLRTAATSERLQPANN